MFLALFLCMFGAAYIGYRIGFHFGREENLYDARERLIDELIMFHYPKESKDEASRWKPSDS